MTEGTGARRRAAELLVGVLEHGRMLSDLIDESDLSPAERAEAQRLATQTLRHLGPVDRVLRPHLRKAPPSDIRALMRIAVVELALGAPPHGAVNAAVAVARRRGRAKAGLVNAVLRRVSEEGVTLEGREPNRLPNWLRGRLQSAYGKATVAAIEAAHAKTPPVDLTPRAQGLAETLGARELPTGSLRLDRSVQISALPGYEAGQWWVQDAGAALAAKLLAPAPGEQVADLCAAPGGKTLQLAAAGAAVTAVDVSEVRLERLRENLARTELDAQVVAADLTQWTPPAPFDAILLDAPCSATGTIRRHPDLPHVRKGSDLKSLVALQSSLLDRAAAWLRPGGRLVFCTCSLLPEEGERQIEAFLARQSAVVLDRAAMAALPQAWAVPTGLRTRPDYWPELGGIDGFFLSALIRQH